MRTSAARIKYGEECVLFVVFELRIKCWKLRFATNLGQRIRERTVPAGDLKRGGGRGKPGGQAAAAPRISRHSPTWARITTQTVITNRSSTAAATATEGEHPIIVAL